GKELEEVRGRTPEFGNILACIAGFLDKRQYTDELGNKQMLVLGAGGDIKGKERRGIVINRFLGFRGHAMADIRSWRLKSIGS
ncbi:MAG: hypothetical protein ACP5KC_10000, partial [Infirmifilum sp.]